VEKFSVSVIGGSGYTGGELLRLLLAHPAVQISSVSSREHAGQLVSRVHPNLRSFKTNLKFCLLEELNPCDFLFVCLPNGVSMDLIENLLSLSKKIVDLGADFRLNNASEWFKWYKQEHSAPHLLEKFIYGVPEINREHIKQASLVASPGCEAIASILALWPLVKHKLIEPRIIVEAKIGSSAAGSKPSLSSHHPERKGVVRCYMPTGHRHIAELEQTFSQVGEKFEILLTSVAVEVVRGILVTAHTFLKTDVDEKEIWKVFLKEYRDEPFVRIVKESQGIYKYPEPKILQGSNFCEVGFEKEVSSKRVVVMSALDNLMKGAAGNAVQCMNLMMGLPESMGLEFPGLHPI